MVNILNIFRMLFKRRKHSRYNVQDGTFVIVAPGEQKVQIIDISMGGAAFIYQGRPEDLEASGEIHGDVHAIMRFSHFYKAEDRLNAEHRRSRYKDPP